jgi:putative F0F1-ATPase subunit (Ca2+/Mg2+ transporter)
MPSRYELVAEGTSAGILFLIGPVAGYFLGKWIGSWLGLGLIPAYAGAVLGLAAAFLNLLRLIARISK